MSDTNKNKKVTFQSESDDSDFVHKPIKQTKLKVYKSKVYKSKVTKHVKHAQSNPSRQTKIIHVVSPTKSVKSFETKLETNAINVPTVKLEFPHGAIVSINGCDMDNSRWSIRNDAPTFYGCVENPKDYSCADAKKISSNESFVTFVVSGEYEWYDRNHSNVLQSNYIHGYLTLCSYPPKDTVETVPYGEDNFTKWFEKTNTGWRVKIHDAPCYGCGSPWCMLDHDRIALKK